MLRLQPVLGLIAMIGVLYLFSSARKAIRWRIVIWGMVLQFVFALIVLPRPSADGQPAENRFLTWVNNGFLEVVNASNSAAKFVFGEDILKVGQLEANHDVHITPGVVAVVGYSFAFRALPTIIFFSALMAMGYHLGIMQWLVRFFARIMAVTMKTSGAETLSNAANIFVGQTEAPLMIRPYVAKMTDSELMAIMVGGFANTAGGVLAAYVGMLHGLVPNIGAHLMVSSVLTGPSSLMMAKILLPETKESVTAGRVKMDLPKVDANLLDAAARGTTEGLGLALNVGAMLITFMALVALLDSGLGWISTGLFHAAQPLSLSLIFGKVLWPLAWLLGVPSKDCGAVGDLLGIKTFANEFIAYQKLAGYQGASPDKALSPRAYLIASYALCGFANISSIGIQIGGIGAMAPERRSDLARLGWRAMIAGSFATFSAACVVAILTP